MKNVYAVYAALKKIIFGKDLIVGKCYKIGRISPFIFLELVKKETTGITIKIFSEGKLYLLFIGNRVEFEEVT